ncbi:hypothetical protein TCAL_00187 [Tigriopus californicus]|uniref:C2H2-type domain-containing protein n=1 Tax=Tigriopus californicus TaxID=6832 RepID=A0A553P500_TIGCA|nr:hypothetical protein TCAL_00187 [Tigriopus californicus]
MVTSSKDEKDISGQTEHSQIIYKCTWPNCETAMNTQSEIERHIRRHHLKKPDPKSEEERDHEEDFYYEEIQVPCHSQLISKCGSPSAVRPSQFPLVHHGTTPLTSHRIQGQTSSGRAITVLSKVGGRSIHVLADHIDMARPPHENPEYNQLRGGLLAQGTNVSNYNGSKLLRLSPKPTNPVPKSPIRRPRGDTKKCRKVYGMDQKESWCTQCKWKKACSRFSELST